MPGAGGEKPLPAPAAGDVADPVAWASDAFSALNMTWQPAPSKKDRVRVLGKTRDDRALMDVTIKLDRVVVASAVVPILPEYTPLLTFLLAVLVKDATRDEADKWLARHLDKLRRDKPSETTQPWHQWRVSLTTNALGLLTMQVR